MSTTQTLAEYVPNKSFKQRLVSFVNFFSQIRETFNTQETQSSDVIESQKLFITIINKALSNPRCKLLIAPISNTRYIHFDDIFIRMDYNNITIINGVYSYNIMISQYDAEQLITKFNVKLEQTRKQWEREIVSKTHRSLNNILEDLNQ